MATDAFGNLIDKKNGVKQWFLRKEVFDRGVELFSKLDSNRLESNEDILFETVVALAACDALLARSNIRVSKKEELNTTTLKSMKAIWIKWAMDHYTFRSINISLEESQIFSRAARELLERDDDNFVILSLKYTYPSDPKPGQIGKQLSNDEKIFNKMFLAECLNIWRKAEEDVKVRVMEAISRADRRRLKGTSGGSTTQPLEVVRENAETNCLYGLSLRRLKNWVEADEDEAARKASELKKTTAAERNVDHERFVKKKDSLRIKLPSGHNDTVDAPMKKVRPKSAPRMSFGTSSSSYSAPVRPHIIPNGTTTVDVMLNSGLKYVHATRMGREHPADLEKSRVQLVNDIGYVNRNNFDQTEEGTQQYEQCLKEWRELIAEEEKRRKLIIDNEKAFSDWTVIKDNRELALNYLSYITPPVPEKRECGVGETQPTIAYTALGTAALDECVSIGRLLKRIDRSLFSEWYQWANTNPAYTIRDKFPSAATLAALRDTKVLSFTFAMALWDSFDPIACDVHSSVSSQVRSSFLKLLRPGLDYFPQLYNWALKIANKEVWTISYQFQDDGNPTRERSRDMLDLVTLSYKKLTSMLTSMGISMKQNEIEALWNALNFAGDKRLSVLDFLDFIGPVRDGNAGTLAILKRKCCWLTTCTKTGMPNAYTVLKSGAVPATISVHSPTIETIQLLTGDIRQKVELNERKKREELLLRYNLLPISKHDTDKASSPTKADNTKDGIKLSTNTSSCGYSTWNTDISTKALNELSVLTKSVRAEIKIKELMSNGEPPRCPKLWSASSTDRDVLSAENAKDVLCSSILLKWGADDNGKEEFISFFVVEYGGQVTDASKGDRKYKEVCRDPPDASHNKFAFLHWFQNIKPGTSHAFRIRAFNGFGPSKYTYRIFSSRAMAPTGLTVLSCTSSSITLGWTSFDPLQFPLRDLKKVFDLIAIAENEGEELVSVNKDELHAVIDENLMNYPLILKLVKQLQSVTKMRLRDIFEDMSEYDDDQISWMEIERYCRQYLNDNTAIDVNNNSKKISNRSITDSNGNSTNGDISRISYVVESCISEKSDIYRECGRSTGTDSVTISRLSPGTSYRLRVYGVNTDNQAGPVSDSIIVHTLLETPAPPIIRLKSNNLNEANEAEADNSNSSGGIFPDKVLIQWKDVSAHIDKSNYQIILNEWAGITINDGGPIDVFKYFSKFDRHQDGQISKSDLKSLLRELSVEYVDEKINLISSKMTNDMLAYADFVRWWYSTDKSYILSRSDVILLANEPIEANQGRKKRRGGGKMTKVVYRGDGLGCEVVNLEPNSLYNFRLKLTCSKSQSNYSIPLEVMTTCIPCDRPLLVFATSNSARVRWYNPQFGAHKYLVELRIINSDTNKTDWETVYIGNETLWIGTNLASETTYEVRVTGINKCEVYGMGSPSLIFSTRSRTDKMQNPFSITNAKKNFVIESCGDICLGDTILITERIYSKPFAVNQRTDYISYQSTDLFADDNLQYNKTFNSPDETIGNTFSVNTKPSIGRPMSNYSRRINSSNSTGIEKWGPNGNKRISVNADGRSTSRIENRSNIDIIEQNDKPTFIGDRTMVVHVVKDNFKTLKNNASNRAALLNAQTLPLERNLWLEIVWQKCSANLSSEYELKPHEVVIRRQCDLEEFEVYRCAWAEDNRRKSLNADLWNQLESV